MNEESVMTPQDLKDTTSDLGSKVKKEPEYGPGYINLAIPDVGHIGSCSSIEFNNAQELNMWCADLSNRQNLIVHMFPRGDKIFVIYNVLKEQRTVDEMNFVSREMDVLLQKFRADRAKEIEDAKTAEEKAVKVEEELTQIGKACIAKHGALTSALIEGSKFKSKRQDLASMISKCLEKAGVSATAQQEMGKLLKTYVKEGM
jgi:hypothetical protein